MPAAEQKIIINASPEQCFSIIIDYEKYPEFLSEMRSVSIERREEDFALVAFELDLMMRVQYTLRLFEDRPNLVRWSLEYANIMKVNNGKWKLREVDKGVTEATYSLDLVLKGLVPKSVTTKLAVKTLPKTLEAFKARIESVVEG
jgi:coenzyme Q-binding protein COQ10